MIIDRRSARPIEALWEELPDLLVGHEQIVHRTGLDADVPSCEGWAMRDLLWHVSEVWTFWGFVASQGATQRSDFDSFREVVISVMAYPLVLILVSKVNVFVAGNCAAV